VLIIFHNIGINPATIDAAMEAKKNGVKIIAVSSQAWQTEMLEDHFIRHPNKTNLNDYADVCIEDFNPVGDAVVTVPGLDTRIKVFLTKILPHKIVMNIWLNQQKKAKNNKNLTVEGRK
jgi:uncharacterized phosphosugar-binding protein